jgi:methionine synthase II (cobalamin-independent)
MVIFHKITWKEFEKIIQILGAYKIKATKINHEDGSWFDNILANFSEVKKQPYNPDVGDLSKKDFNRITVIIDVWNAAKNPIGAENIAYDDECDVISSKLQRAYFKTFNEHVFPDN